MPYGDGTGPQGVGPMTGWDKGPCGSGLRKGRGGGWFGRGMGYFGLRRGFPKNEKDALDEEEKMLKEKLAQVQKEKAALKNN